MDKKTKIIHVNNNLEQDFCPLCNSKDIYEIGRLGYRKNINFSTHVIELTHFPELWKCRRCRSCFVQKAVHEEIARKLYSTGKAGDRWSTIAFDHAKTHEVVKNMTEVLGGKKSVLDVGSNTGELLDFAKRMGCKTAGVEFSSESRRSLNDKGHKSYSAFEESLGNYDVITAFDLVEHLYNVPAFLESCHEKLAERGRLIILTGNIGSLSAKLSSSRWWYTQYPEHIIFPSKHYFSEFSGFKIERWILTYASIGYKHSICKIGLELLKSGLRGKSYTGLPALGADHVLAVLKK